jgi:hypothetical protein
MAAHIKTNPLPHVQPHHHHDLLGEKADTLENAQQSRRRPLDSVIDPSNLANPGVLGLLKRATEPISNGEHVGWI